MREIFDEVGQKILELCISSALDGRPQEEQEDKNRQILPESPREGILTDAGRVSEKPIQEPFYARDPEKVPDDVVDQKG